MPRNGSATRQRILDAAQRLVIENGYSATSVDRVIAASATSKGSFFHHFASKDDLARALVDRYAAADIAQLDEALAHVTAATDDPVERVLGFVAWFENDAEQNMTPESNCLYISVLTERELVARGTSAQITAAIEAWRVAFADLLRAALPDGSAIDPDALSDHVFVTFEGAFILCRATGEPSHMRAQLRIVRQLLEALLRAV